MDERAWCKHCGYALDGLAGTACPECGRAFAPGDPSSYRGRAFVRARTDTSRVLVMLACYPLLVLSGVGATWLSASIVLGRWPCRHDPKDIAITVDMLSFRTKALLAASPCALLLLTCALLSSVLYIVRQWRCVTPHLASGATFSLLAWILTFVLLGADPFGIVSWLFG